MPGRTQGKIVACFIRLAERLELPSDDDLKAFVRGQLSPQKTPAHWVWVDAFPLTGSGKIQKFAMVESFVKGALG
ncbi:MAG: hypothetical protein WBA51_07650 [Erythrobacter sp.]